MGVILKSVAMRISEVAKLIGRSVDTIKRWEAQGLIQPQRDVKGQRQFSPTDVEACFRLADLSMVAQHDSVKLSLLVELVPEQLSLIQSRISNFSGGQ